MHSLEPNAIFAGRYRIIGCIAAGGMGAVYEVIHLETERRRALKVMHAHFVQSPELRDRFKREAKVAAQIDSEFVVDVFDAGIDDATQMPFLVMELLKGEELGKRLERVGRFAPPDAITYLWQTALALDRTHQAHIVHRDLKPENLFLTQREDGPPRIKVLDFGVAKFVAETGTQGATRSLGTPVYMSPEQFRSHKVTAASDIYALALMAYTLLVGDAYWAIEASGDVDVVGFALKAYSGPVELATVRAGRRGIVLPPSFDAWFARSTATDPLARPQRATVCISELAEVFGLNPRQMTGLGSSDPLPQLRLGETRPLGTPPGFGSGTEAGASPGHSSVAPTPTVAVPHLLASASDPAQATVVGVAVPASPPREASSFPLAAVMAGVAFVVLAAGAAVYLVGGRHSANGEAPRAGARERPVLEGSGSDGSGLAPPGPSASALASPLAPQEKPRALENNPRAKAKGLPGKTPSGSTSSGYSQD